jgi:hypothetical protein
MAKTKISQTDYSTIVLGMQALINELDAKNSNNNFTETIANAKEIHEYLSAKIEKRERLGIGWGA